MTSAMAALEAARLAWERSQPQLFFDFAGAAHRGERRSEETPATGILLGDQSLRDCERAESVRAPHIALNDPAPAATYGSADAHFATLQARGVNPGPETTSSVGGTIGASPPSRRASPPSRMRPPTGTAHSYGDGRATLGEEAAVAGGDST